MSNLWVSIENLRVGSLPKGSDGNLIDDCAALTILMAAQEYSFDFKIDYPMIASEIILEKQRHRKEFIEDSDFWFEHHCGVPQFLTEGLIQKLTDLSWKSICLPDELPVWKIAKWCYNRDLIVLNCSDHVLALRSGIIYDTWNSRSELIDDIFVPEFLYETIRQDIKLGGFLELLKVSNKKNI